MDYNCVDYKDVAGRLLGHTMDGALKADTHKSFRPEDITTCICSCCSNPLDCIHCRIWNNDRYTCQDKLEGIVKRCVVSAEALTPLTEYTKEQNELAVQGMHTECGTELEDMEAFYNALNSYHSKNYGSQDGIMSIVEAMQGFFRPFAEMVNA